MTYKPVPPNPKGKRQIKINAITQAKLIKLLLEGTYTCKELAEMTGLHYVTVLQYTRELHRAKAAYISAWDKDPRGRDLAKIYKLGEGRDAKRQKITAGDRQRAYRTKLKQMKIMEQLCSVPSAEPSHESLRQDQPEMV